MDLQEQSQEYDRPWIRSRRRLVAAPHNGGRTRKCATSATGDNMIQILRKLWTESDGQDIAEYAVMLAVILVIVVGTIRLIGTNANNAFSAVASSIQQ